MAEPGVIPVRVSIRGDKAGTRRVTRNLDQIRKRSRRTGTEMQRMGGRAKSALSGVATQLAAIAGGFTAVAAVRGAVRTTAQFAQSMSNVRAVTQATRGEFERLQAQAKELGETTRFSASQAASGMEFLGRAGFETNEVISSMPDMLNLAAAAGMDLGRAADITSNIMAGFRLEVDQTGRMTDVLAATAASANTNVEMLGDAMSFAAPVAAGLGMEIESTSAAIGVLSNAGIQGGRAGTTLRRMLMSLIGPTSKARKELESMGVDAQELADVLQGEDGLVRAMRMLRNAGVGVEEAKSIGGVRGGPGLQVLVENIEKLEELQGTLDKAQGSAEEMAGVMEDNLAGSFRTMKSAIEANAISFGEGLTPALREAMEEVTNLSRESTDASRSLGEKLGKGVKFVARNLDNLISGVKILVAYKLAAWGLAAAEGMVALGKGFLAAARGAKTLQLSLGPLSIIILTLVTTWQALEEVVDRWSDKSAKQTEQIVSDTQKLKNIQQDAWRAMDQAGNLQELTTMVAEYRGEIDSLTEKRDKLGELRDMWAQIAEESKPEAGSLGPAPEQYRVALANLKKIESSYNSAGQKLGEYKGVIGELEKALDSAEKKHTDIREEIEETGDTSSTAAEGISEYAEALSGLRFETEIMRQARALRFMGQETERLLEAARTIGVADLEDERVKKLAEQMKLLENQVDLYEDLEVSHEEMADSAKEIFEQATKTAGATAQWNLPTRLRALEAVGREMIAIREEAEMEEAIIDRLNTMWDEGLIPSLELAVELAERFNAAFSEEGGFSGGGPVKGGSRWLDVMLQVGDAFSGVNDQFDQMAGGIQKAATGMQAFGEESATASEKAEGLAGTLHGITQIAGAVGLVGQSNYAAEGQIAGAIVGAIVGIILQDYSGQSGAAVGGAAGGMIGSLIPKGPPTGRVQIDDDAGQATSKILRADKQLSGAMKQAGTSVTNALNEITRMIGGFMADIHALEIKQRGDEIDVFVNGAKTVFSDMGDAIDFAIRELVRTGEFVGISETMKAVLENEFASVDELTANIDFAKAIENMGLDEAAIAVKSQFEGFQANIMRAIDLDLPAESFEKLMVGFTDGLKQVRDNILNVKEDPRETLRRQAEAFNRRVKLQKAQLLLMKAELESRAQYTEVNAKLTEGQGKIMEGDLRAKKAFLKAEAELAQAEGKLNEQQIKAQAAMVEAQGVITNAAWEALQIVEEVLAELPDLLISEEEIAQGIGRIGGGGQRKSDRKALGDTLDDFFFERSLDSMSQFEASMARINRKWDEQALKAHGNADALERIARAREEDIAALREEETASLNEDIEGFFSGAMGTAPLKQLEEQAQGLRDRIRDLGLSADATAEKLWFVNQAEKARREQLNDQTFAGLLRGLDSVLDDQELSVQLAQVEAKLKVANWKMQVRLLEELALLSGETIDWIRDLIDKAEKELEKPPAPRVNRSAPRSNPADDLKRKRESLISELERWENLAFDPLSRELKALNEQFARMKREAAETGISVQRVKDAYEIALEDFWNRALDPLKRFREGLDTGPTSLLSPEGQFGTLKSNFEGAVNAVLGGDLSQISDVQSIASELLGVGREHFGAGGFADLREFVDSMLDQVLALAPNSGEESIQSSIAENTEAQVVELAAIREEMEQLRESNERMERQMRRFLDRSAA